MSRMTKLNLGIVILITSAVMSGMLWLGRIDQDFFSYYYIGQGILKGKDMYKDFFENKGPVAYGFFAGLAAVFGREYGWAVVAASSLLDATTVFFGWLVIKEWTKGIDDREDNKWWWVEAIAATAIYKSVSIGNFMGGVYTETIAMGGLMVSFWLLEKRRYKWSGVLFALAVLTRQTILFFVVAIAVRMWQKKTRKDEFLGWLGGLVVTGGVIVGWIWKAGSLGYMIENMITTSLAYSEASKHLVLINLVYRFAYETRLLFFMLLITVSAAVTVMKKQPSSKKIGFLALVASSVLATFVGGIFYFHHFVQMMPVLGMSYILRPKNKVLQMLFGWIGVFAVMWVGVGFLIYVFDSDSEIDNLQSAAPVIEEMRNKKYMVSVPFFPRLYIDYGLPAPDAYFFPGWILKELDLPNREIHLQRHLGLEEEKLRETLFLMVYRSEREKVEVDSYIKDVGSRFRIVKRNDYVFGDAKIEVWESEL